MSNTVSTRMDASYHTSKSARFATDIPSGMKHSRRQRSNVVLIGSSIKEMGEETLRQFLGTVVSVQVEPKRLGKTGQGHDEEIKTVHKTHLDAWDFDVHELASGKDNFGHEPNVQ